MGFDCCTTILLCKGFATENNDACCADIAAQRKQNGMKNNRFIMAIILPV
jgi:hypothetical protein